MAHFATGIALLLIVATTVWSEEYYGKKIGTLSTLFHEITGDVYAVDSKTLHIRKFKYDGAGPDAYFWAGSTPEPSADGFIVPDEKGTKEVLQPYNGKHLTLQLPDGKTLKDIKWFSVWCKKFRANFGFITIPDGFKAPEPLTLGPIPGVEHNTSSGPVVIVDAQTFMVPDFTLDGLAPDAHFWVGKGSPSPNGILVPDEEGSDKPLGLYDKKTVVVTLPNDVTVFDIDYFGVWCKIAAADFGHLKMPAELNIPPSPRMLGQSVKDLLNCEVLHDNPPFEVRWAMSSHSIIIQLASTIPLGDYMSFGLSGDSYQSIMIGGDITVAWMSKDNGSHAVDYYIDAKAQCAGGRGTCPDDSIKENSNNIQFLNAVIVDNYQVITFSRPLETGDTLDKSFVRDFPQAVIWALGPMNSKNEASYHYQRTKGTQFIVFSRYPAWNCPSSIIEEIPNNQQTFTTLPPVTTSVPQLITLPTTPTETQKLYIDSTQKVSDAWYIPPINCNEPADGVFYAQIGPTGGKKGYSAITGSVGWGISWYINGLLIPEITVVRGRTYRFVIEGGADAKTPARNHPFYITDDPVGGFGTQTTEEREKVKIFVGVQETEEGPKPTGVGRLCQWMPTVSRPAEEFSSFGEFQRHLELRCGEGRPGMLAWIPDADTPDTVYYQCYTHRYLGWKINVVDSCDVEPEYEASIIHEVRALPPNAKSDFQKAKESNYFQNYNAIHPVTKNPKQVKNSVNKQLTTKSSSTYHSTDNYRQKTENTNNKEPNFFIIQIKSNLNATSESDGEMKMENLFWMQSGESVDLAASEQNPVVFRAQGGRNNIPPLPLNLPLSHQVPQRPPPSLQIQINSAQPVSYDGSPVTNSRFTPINPTGPQDSLNLKPAFSVLHTRPFGPFRGNKPPPVPEHVPPLPQFQPRISANIITTTTTKKNEADYAILSNVWNIISSQGGIGSTRQKRDAMEISYDDNVTHLPEPNYQSGTVQLKFSSWTYFLSYMLILSTGFLL